MHVDVVSGGDCSRVSFSEVWQGPSGLSVSPPARLAIARRLATCPTGFWAACCGAGFSLRQALARLSGMAKQGDEVDA